MRFRALLAPAVATLILALAACGSSSGAGGMDHMPGMGQGSNSTPSAASGSSATTVTVSLSDFKIVTSQATFKVGVPYHFVVTNAQSSTTNHELMLIMPMNGDGMSMGDMDKAALARIAADDLPPGTTKSFDYTFQKAFADGDLELACHMGSHYSLGMHIPVTVTKY